MIVAPPGANACSVLLAKAVTNEQETHIENQTSGRVFLLLHIDDFWRDYHRMIARNIKFVRPPIKTDYGMVAVFKDLYGNQWDLLEPNDTKMVNM